jgi:NAD(P)H-nitrite reductase large subunit
MRVTLVVSSDRILSRNLDRTGSDLIARAVGRSGITVLLNSQAVEFSRGRRTPLSLVLENGNPLQAHLVVLAKSVTPNIGLAAKSALSVHDGIVVNETLQTSREQVFAAGDVAEFQERVNFIWPNAIEQGRLAGLNMAGENASYQAGIGMNVTELFGIKIASIGKTEPEQGEEEICRLDAERAVYRKVILNEGRMTGALLVGDITDCGILHRLIRNRNHVAAYLTKLMTHSAGLANAFYAGSEPR